MPGPVDVINAGFARTTSWSVAAIVTLLLGGIGLVVVRHIDSANQNATLLAQPHEVQTALQHIGAAIDAVDDSVQDYIIEGTQGIRIKFQYEDAARSLSARVAELRPLSSPAMSTNDLAELDRRVAEVLSASAAVIDAGDANRAETLRRLAEEGRATNTANRKVDALIAEQQQLLRTHQWSLQRDMSQISGGLAATAAVVLFVLAATIVLVEFDQRRQAALRDHLRSQNEQLDIAVKERSETLAQANRELTWFSKRALQIQEQERRNLALELHDQVGQELAALVVTLTRCEREIEPAAQSEHVRSAVQASIEIARAAYGDVHNLALELRPAILDRLGLIPTLQWYARQQAKHGRCEITVEADAFPTQLPSDLLTAAYRIVQEAVSNAVRHGNPKRIDIRAHYRPGSIELQIRDDGIGFDASTPVAPEHIGGLGLVGIRQRAADLGGRVSIGSHPGSGTEIVATLPAPETT